MKGGALQWQSIEIEAAEVPGREEIPVAERKESSRDGGFW